MTLTLEQLTTPLTVDEVRTSVYSVLETIGVSATGWKPGAVARTMVTAISVLGAAFSEIMVGLNKSRFLELAEEGWAEQVGHYDYGTDRNDATFAAGEVTLTNIAGGSYSYTPYDVTFINSSTGKTYRNTESFTLAPGTPSVPTTATFAVQATEVGIASNALPGAIDELETALTGVSVTNDDAVLGLDQESLTPYKARCLAQPDTNSTGGMAGSYLYWAMRATRPDGTSLGINRVKVVSNSTTGAVTVYCATADPVVPSGDLVILDDLFQTYVLPIPATLTVLSAAAYAQNLTYTVWAYKTAALTTDSLRTLIDANLATFQTELPIGGHVYGGSPTGEVPLNSIEAAIQDTRPEIFKVEVTTPSADVSLAFNQALAWNTVTSTINWV